MNKQPRTQRKSKAVMRAALRARDLREIRRRIKHHEDPVRYVVYVQPGRGASTRLFLDVSGDVYGLNDWTRATLFKRKTIARLVARAYSVGRKRPLQVARVTITAWGKQGRRATL